MRDGHRAVRRWRSRVGLLDVPRPLVVSALLALAAVTGFAINFERPFGQQIVYWLPATASLAVTAHTAWRTAQTTALPAATRRFWRHVTVAVVLVTAGCVSNAHDALAGPTVSQHISPATLAAYSAGITVVIWGLLRLPLSPSPGERLRIGLDAGTVVLAAAVFMWHYQTRMLLSAQADQRSSVLTSGAAMVLALVAVFSVAKVVLSGHEHVDKRALRLLALAVLGGSLGEIPQSYLRDRPQLVCTQVAVPVAAALVLLAALQQRGATTRNSRGAVRARPRRPYSVLPYLAVAAVDGLLVGSTWTGHDNDHAVIVAVAVALTAVVVLRQLTAFQEIRRLLARLDHNATHDTLTQLPNRALFQQRLRTALHPRDHAAGQVWVALIDLDNFKTVNDTLGHGVGDGLLTALAPRLRASVRAEDLIARLGGDEFVVILEDVDQAEAARLTQGMIDTLATPVRAGGHELLVQASIGLAGGQPGADPDELLRQADIAMYAAKITNGSWWVRFTEDLDHGGGPVAAPARRAARTVAIPARPGG